MGMQGGGEVAGGQVTLLTHHWCIHRLYKCRWSAVVGVVEVVGLDGGHGGSRLRLKVRC